MVDTTDCYPNENSTRKNAIIRANNDSVSTSSNSRSGSEFSIFNETMIEHRITHTTQENYEIERLFDSIALLQRGRMDDQRATLVPSS